MLRPFWIASAILLGLFALLQWNISYLDGFVRPLQDTLAQAEALVVEEEDWESAQALTQEVHEAWEEKQFYLHVTLRHSDIDQVIILLEQVEAYLQHQKTGEYAAVNKALIGQLELLMEMEALDLRNIL